MTLARGHERRLILFHILNGGNLYIGYAHYRCYIPEEFFSRYHVKIRAA
jgi:hypothetical protein